MSANHQQLIEGIPNWDENSFLKSLYEVQEISPKQLKTISELLEIYPYLETCEDIKCKIALFLWREGLKDYHIHWKRQFLESLSLLQILDSTPHFSELRFVPILKTLLQPDFHKHYTIKDLIANNSSYNSQLEADTLFSENYTRYMIDRAITFQGDDNWKNRYYLTYLYDPFFYHKMMRKYLGYHFDYNEIPYKYNVHTNLFYNQKTGKEFNNVLTKTLPSTKLEREVTDMSITTNVHKVTNMSYTPNTNGSTIKSAAKNVGGSLAEGFKQGAQLAAAHEFNGMIAKIISDLLVSKFGLSKKDVESETSQTLIKIASPALLLILTEIWGDEIPHADKIKFASQKALTAISQEKIQEILSPFMGQLAQIVTKSEEVMNPAAAVLKESEPSFVDTITETQTESAVS